MAIGHHRRLVSDYTENLRNPSVVASFVSADLEVLLEPPVKYSRRRIVFIA